MSEKKIKKTTTKKTVGLEKPVTKSNKLDSFLRGDVLTACNKNEIVADKILQLIGDYSFEKDQTERQRCICIAFGNWRYGAEFDAKLGTMGDFEVHNFKKCEKILKKLLG